MKISTLGRRPSTKAEAATAVILVAGAVLGLAQSAEKAWSEHRDVVRTPESIIQDRVDKLEKAGRKFYAALAAGKIRTAERQLGHARSYLTTIRFYSNETGSSSIGASSSLKEMESILKDMEVALEQARFRDRSAPSTEGRFG